MANNISTSAQQGADSSAGKTPSKQCGAIPRFQVTRQAVEKQRLPNLSESNVNKAWHSLADSVEARSPTPENTVIAFDTHSALAHACYNAFYKHYPLRLSPDALWITILQGVAHHVNNDPEKYRSKFVSHEGKQQIVISRPDFVKGSPKNDWPGVFPDFSHQIGLHIGAERKGLIEASFTTTGPVESICYTIALMDTLQAYFEYVMYCGCGIPSIELTGTPTDWTELRVRAESLLKIVEGDLDWWGSELLPVLDQFVSAANGSPDQHFWASTVNFSGASGMKGAPITGWLQTLFPYLLSGHSLDWDNTRPQGMVRNGAIDQWRKAMEAQGSTKKKEDSFDRFSYPRGVKLESLPGGLSSAPFKYVDAPSGKTYDMSFVGGLAYVTQDSDGTLEPTFGWAVVNDKPKPQVASMR